MGNDLPGGQQRGGSTYLPPTFRNDLSYPSTVEECATVLTTEKVRCSPSSPCSRATGRAVRGSGWLHSSHLLRCAPWLERTQVGTGKQARRSNRKAGFLRSLPGRCCRALD